jgi:signal transduction histidine kinase
MRFRTWPVAALGFGGLLLLIALSMVALSERAKLIYSELDELNTKYTEVDAKLRRLRSDVNLSGIFVRDYLLDVARERAPEYREQLTQFRQKTLTTLAQLRASLGQDDPHIASLQAQLEQYWEAFEPLFDWTPAEKILRSARFLREEVVPRRDAALAIAQEIESLNNANVAAQRAEVTRRYAAFRNDLQQLMWRSLLVGLFVALAAVFRLRILERRAEEQRELAAVAERQMRQLSQRLVAAQEEERKNLSRELHDHVAQVLTALKMELGRVDRLAPSSDPRHSSIAECRRLVDQMFGTVRDLALGLRPSMLDDFGLQAALEWHVRDFTRRYGINVQLKVDPEFADLPDPYRTCVYRVVQEAMINCVRHARAANVSVKLRSGDGLNVIVQDDGVGLRPGARREGLGLRGIEERVHELGGRVQITGAPNAGTTLIAVLPRPSSVGGEVTFARAAG